MIIRYKCPLCKQTDKGFSRQVIVANDMDNVGKIIGPTEVLEDATLYYCLAIGCEGVGGYLDVAYEATE